MNVTLWIIAIVLAGAFGFAGFAKLITPKEKLAEQMDWVEDFSQPTIRFIGLMEVLGALGLVLPAAFGIAPVLTPLAASGLALTMLLAALTHTRRKEPQMVVVNLVLGALALFVAVMRFGPNAF